MAVSRRWGVLGLLALVGALVVALVWAQGAAARAPTAASAERAAPTSVGRLRMVARTSLRAIAATRAPQSAVSADGAQQASVLAATGAPAEDSAPEPPLPAAPSTPVVDGAPGFSGFFGLTAADSVAAGGREGEPADLGLCVGDGRALEVINTVLTVYDAGGARLMSPVGLNQFLGLPPEVAVKNGREVFGPATFDPDCLFDHDTGRYVVVATSLGIDPAKNEPDGTAALFIAVSATSDPAGRWTVFRLDTTSGDAADGNCPPCFDDFPKVGADANGFYVSANRANFAGEELEEVNAKIHAFSKTTAARAAEKGGRAPRITTITPGPAGGEPASTAWPAVVPPGAPQAVDREYFLSTPAAVDDRVILWALSNTDSLGASRPALRLSQSVVRSAPYVGPEGAVQKDGPRPLGESVGEPVPELDAGRPFAHRVTYLDGTLWATIPTAVQPQSQKVPRTGVLWIAVAPGPEGGPAGARVVRQGYLATDQDSLLYPAIGLNARGQGAMVFSVVGPTRFPSTGYVEMGPEGPTGGVRVPGQGVAPEDGFTCYQAFGPTPGCRWGDYSAAQADADGSIWMASHLIPPLPRTEGANYGTFVGRLVR